MRKHILIFGNLNKTQEYSRSFILCKAFENLGFDLSYCVVDSGFKRFSISPMRKIIGLIVSAPLRWVRLIFKYFFLQSYDLIYVPYPSHTDAWIACILAKIKHRPIVIDAFFGLYDTIIRDRKIFAPKSIIAQLIWHYEKQLLKSTDCAIVDTEEHVLLLKKDFKLLDQQIRAIPVGIDESLWSPENFLSEKVFKVVFWSTFIPLHGCEVVVRAAKLLEKQPLKIQFLVIGKGQEAKNFKQVIEYLKPNNLKWIEDFIPLQEIQKYVQQSHCCLGIFGTEEKTQRVIPYKAYQALASCRPLITARTKSSKALFTDGVDALLVNPGDPADLASKIKRLAKNQNQAISIGKNGRRLYETRLSNAVIRNQLEHIIESVTR